MKNEKKNAKVKEDKMIKNINAELSDNDLDKVAGGVAVQDDRERINQNFMDSQTGGH